MNEPLNNQPISDFNQSQDYIKEKYKLKPNMEMEILMVPTKEETTTDNQDNEGNRESTASNKSTDDPEKVHLARRYQLYSIGCVIISNALIKMTTSIYDKENFPQFVYLTLRFWFICLFAIWFLGGKTKSLFIIPASHLKWIVIRIIIWFLSFWFFALSVNYLKIGLATLLLMTSPILQNVVYALAMNKRINVKYIFMCLISIIGVCVIFSDTYNDNPSSFDLLFGLGVMYGLLNSMFSPFLYVSSKFLFPEYAPMNVNYICGFWDGVLSLILCFLFTPYDFPHFLNVRFILYNVVNSFFTLLGFKYATLSVIMADVSKFSYISYLKLPFMALFGIAFYGERYGFVEILGFLLIIISSVYTSYYI